MTRAAAAKKTSRPAKQTPRGSTRPRGESRGRHGAPDQRSLELDGPASEAQASDAGKTPAGRKGSVERTGNAKRRAAAAATTPLGPLVDQLTAAVAEVPRARDFEPLAEHLYAFAEAAPALDESLRALPGAIHALHEALAKVQETTTTLDDLHSSFSLAFLKLPSASDYEPLVEPLLAFARSSPVLLARLEEALLAVGSLTRALDERPPEEDLRVLAEPARELGLVAPALSEALSRLPPLVEPLTRTLSELGPLADRMHAAAERMNPSQGIVGAPRGEEVEDAVLCRVTEAREAILEALAGLPREEDYGPFARQLREIASVSPSLLSWLREVPSISTPLGASVRGLLDAAEKLKEARALLRP